MTVITDITVPAEQFALGQLFEAFPDIQLELERLVPLQGGIIPLFWVEAVSPEEVEATVSANRMVEEVRLLTELEGRYLFRIRWGPEVNSLIHPMIDSGARILWATGNAEAWAFRLQFEDRDRLNSFWEGCLDVGVQVHLDAIYNPERLDTETPELTAEQYDVIEMAYNHGYWDVPRQVSQVDLATNLDISSAAVSQRLRRGLRTLVGKSLQER